MNFIIDKIPQKANEGLFFGNGKIGCLMYVRQKNCLHFSIDHNMLWETRDERAFEVTPFKEVSKHKEDFVNGKFSVSTCSPDKIYPTKLPGLGLDFKIDGPITSFYATLNIDTAVSTFSVSTAEQTYRGTIYLNSLRNVIVMNLSDNEWQPSFAGWDFNNKSLSFLKQCGYHSFEQKTNNDIHHYIQSFDSNSVAVCSILQIQNKVYITLAIDTNNHPDELFDQNEKILLGYVQDEEKCFQAHKKDWTEFWSKSSICIPDQELQEAYNMELYKMHCNIRADALPVTLQGVWNTDERMPPWLGDWHNDLNVQACYWPCYRTNHAQDAKSYIDYYSLCKPQFEQRAKEYFGIENGIHIPVTMAPGGHGSGSEWTFWNMLLGGELMVAVDFCMYYEYTQENDTLKEKIYPFLKEVLNSYMSIAYEAADGHLHIPFTNSPEVANDNNKLLLASDSTFILSSLHYILNQLQKYSQILNLPSEECIWSKLDQKLVQVHTKDNCLPLFPNILPQYSHRHFCQLYPIFPLSTDTHNEVANQSLNQVINLGLTGYAAFSFPYMSMFASRCGRGNMAYIMLKIYTSAFRTGNTFTVNGDPRNSGLLAVSSQSAGEDADAFTLEAGFMLASALCDMFAHRSGDHVYIGAGIPDDWKEAECKNVRIEGGHLVSIVIRNYKVSELSIIPYKDETLNIMIFPDKKCHKALLKKGIPYKINSQK